MTQYLKPNNDSPTDEGDRTAAKPGTAFRIKLFIVLLLLTLAGVGPIPITSVIGMFVVLFRPAWFKNLVLKLYGEKDVNR
ncbi:MAG: hypothetical protein ACU837_08055 [Gammaproteobacteria bacterium]